MGAGFAGRPWPDRAPASYCCYGCLSLGEQSRQESQSPSSSSFKLDGFAVRIGIGLLVASQSMIFGLAINLEEGTPPAVKLVVQSTILAGTLLVLGLLAGPLFRTAFTELRQRRLTIEALFLLTMCGAMFASCQSMIVGHGPIYFEVVTVLLVVYSLGKTIGARSRAAALASTRLWGSSQATCRLLDAHGREWTVEVTTILPGDTVEVRPGETIAIDGTIQQGIGFISEAVVSGEPFPVVRRPGDQVLAGMASHDATFRIEATAPGSARQIDRLLQSVEEARQRPTSLQSQADRLGQFFFPLIVGVAVITFAVWTHLAGWETGLFNAMSVLLVACPCALGLATPIVIWSALTRLAERGIVAHAGDVVERLASVDRILFDKTGTLTEEQFALVDIVTFAEGNERARLLGIVSLVEEHSTHPIAKAFAGLPVPPERMPQVVSLRVVPGCGIEAEIEDQGVRQQVRIGQPQWLASPTDEQHAALESRLLARTGHQVAFELDGQLVALATVTERLRESVPETLAVCRAMKLPVEVLTGNTQVRAEALSLPQVQAGLLPEDKSRYIQHLLATGFRPLMVGDGINDAAALAMAHASIALSSGTELANSAASATLYHGDLRALPWAIALSREAVRAVRRNLWRAASYNLIGITLAAFGVLHPVVAALLMVVSSLLVTWSSVRIGVPAEVCCVEDSVARDEPAKPRAAALIHFGAIFLQGAIALLLVDRSVATGLMTVGVFLLLALSLAYVWSRWSTIPHALDMAIGMLTLGNFGMLLGWWADNGFARLHNGGCCECVQALHAGVMKPWMWLGMLFFANTAMLFLGRRSHPDVSHCKTAMFTGGNLGMVGGMLFGGWLAAQTITESVPVAALFRYLGMTIGMILGMLLAYEATRRLIAVCWRWRFLPRWMLRTGPVR